MLRLIPKHKASEKKQCDLKHRISVLRKEIAQGKPAPGAAAVVIDPYHIPTSGGGQVVVLGLPNTGKSSVLAAVTNAAVKVADYPFTTVAPIPGMWRWEDVQIQLVDTPPMTAEHVEGGLINMIHGADVVALTVDAASPESLDQADTALSLLAARNIELVDCAVEDIPFDKPDGKPGLIVVTHADLVPPEDIATMAEMYAGRLTVSPLACTTPPTGFEEFGKHVWRLMHVLRVYTKRPGQKADMAKPYTLHIGATVDDLARAIHRDLPEKLKFARVWGSARHDGQQVHRTEELHDRDIVELHE